MATLDEIHVRHDARASLQEGDPEKPDSAIAADAMLQVGDVYDEA